VELGGDESINDFLMDEAAVAGEKHQITRQALSGQVLDTRFENKLKEVRTDAYESVRGQIRQAGAGLDSEYERIRAEYERTRAEAEIEFSPNAQQVDLSPDEEG
jgi:hypothetical protein